MSTKKLQRSSFLSIYAMLFAAGVWLLNPSFAFEQSLTNYIILMGIVLFLFVPGLSELAGVFFSREEFQKEQIRALVVATIFLLSGIVAYQLVLVPDHTVPWWLSAALLLWWVVYVAYSIVVE